MTHSEPNVPLRERMRLTYFSLRRSRGYREDACRPRRPRADIVHSLRPGFLTSGAKRGASIFKRVEP